MAETDTFVRRERVRHNDYNTVGEITEYINDQWVRIAWDDGSKTVEMIEDLTKQD